MVTVGFLCVLFLFRDFGNGGFLCLFLVCCLLVLCGWCHWWSLVVPDGGVGCCVRSLLGDWYVCVPGREIAGKREATRSCEAVMLLGCDLSLGH